jgi:hypothetical protein
MISFFKDYSVSSIEKNLEEVKTKSTVIICEIITTVQVKDIWKWTQAVAK